MNASTHPFVVRVTKDFLIFSAGHFITLEGGICERVHGHNWRLALEVEGCLNEHGYVFDFIALLEIGRAIAAQLDHRMLLPDGSGGIAINDDGPNWRVTFENRYWSFPKDECAVLPISNTTTELVARWIGQQATEALRARGTALPNLIRVELEENSGQSATVTLAPNNL